jgi:XTP/dITP diphosphohydrolase
MVVHRKILVASTNPGTLRDLRELLGGDIEWGSLSDFPDVPEVKEDGKAFAENARKKALGYAKATGLWTLADDSGLVVDALGGQPGVKSARFSGDKDKNRGLLDHKNMAKVLDLLKDVPKEKRSARFVCCLCLASPEKVLIETEGKLEGVITNRQAGENGFGYDPVFYVPKLNKTVAQLTNEEKNAISHRGNAIRKLKPLLNKLLETV